ncbi:hypothetical protein [Alkaliflexus imshenetskii]|uniref:hypothetical protein n=1 Tax=Alkaliflexus imshenetskii TaxID=286730 RepID=UPI00047ED3EF|nr:hypothetical protein [Alkaliflexus imshenetskii]
MEKKVANNLWIGLIIGLVMPLITSYLIYATRYPGDETYTEFIVAMIKVESLGKLLSLSVLPNLLFFFLGIWSERLLAARGVLIATVLYTLASVAMFLMK